MKLSDVSSLPPTLRAEEAAEAFDVSTWSLYEAVKRGDAPVMPLRIGRSLRWPTASVLRAIGIEPDGAT